MRRIISVLVVAALMAAMMVVTALPAFADAGGLSNENACHGQALSGFAKNGAPPGQFQKDFGIPVQEFQQFVEEVSCG